MWQGILPPMKPSNEDDQSELGDVASSSRGIPVLGKSYTKPKLPPLRDEGSQGSQAEFAKRPVLPPIHHTESPKSHDSGMGTPLDTAPG